MKTISNLHDMSPKKLVIAGDWHSDALHMQKVIRYAKTAEADGIVHVGDFGWRHNFYSPYYSGRMFDKPLEREMLQSNLFLIWIDGNHDNHKLLQSLPKRKDGFVQTGKSGKVFWAPRGLTWVWGNITFGALGGAYSVNRSKLKESFTLFSNLEETTISDVNNLGNQKLNVLFTHEIPKESEVKEVLLVSKQAKEESLKNRLLISKAVENTLPEIIFSGHHHQRKTNILQLKNNKKVVNYILDMNGSHKNIVIFDLKKLKVEEPESNWFN